MQSLLALKTMEIFLFIKMHKCYYAKITQRKEIESMVLLIETNYTGACLKFYIILFQMESLPVGLNKGFQATPEGTSFNLWHWLKIQRVRIFHLIRHLY